MERIIYVCLYVHEAICGLKTDGNGIGWDGIAAEIGDAHCEIANWNGWMKL